MHEDIRTLLNAYLDNELHGARLRELEIHLATCESCRNELMELRQVSNLLQASPAPEFMPAGRFASNLALRLPRRDSAKLPARPGSMAWWLVPAGLLGSWFFVQTVFVVTDMVSAARIAGLFGQAASRSAAGQQTIWFSVLSNIIGLSAGGAQSTLSWLNRLDLIGTHLLDGFLWQALIVLLYGGWLVGMWLYRRSHSVQLEKVIQ